MVHSFSSGDGYVRHYVNGVKAQSTATNSVQNTATEGGVAVLGVDISLTHFVKMQVATIAVFDRALSDTERGDVDEFLSTKYGL